MSYRRILFLWLICIGIASPLSIAQAASKNDEWNQLVQEVMLQNPSFFKNLSNAGGKSKLALTKDAAKEERKLARAKQKRLKKERAEKKKLSKKLWRAVKNSDYELVKKYVLAGADSAYASKNGVSLLHVASAQGDIHIVKVLETHGGDFDAKTVKDWTPLHHAARFGHVDVVKYLMSKGANIFQVNTDGKNPYMLARQLQNSEVTRYMNLWRKYH